MITIFHKLTLTIVTLNSNQPGLHRTTDIMVVAPININKCYCSLKYTLLCAIVVRNFILLQILGFIPESTPGFPFVECKTLTGRRRQESS